MKVMTGIAEFEFCPGDPQTLTEQVARWIGANDVKILQMTTNVVKTPALSYEKMWLLFEVKRLLKM